MRSQYSREPPSRGFQSTWSVLRRFAHARRVPSASCAGCGPAGGNRSSETAVGPHRESLVQHLPRSTLHPPEDRRDPADSGDSPGPMPRGPSGDALDHLRRGTPGGKDGEAACLHPTAVLERESILRARRPSRGRLPRARLTREVVLAEAVSLTALGTASVARKVLDACRRALAPCGGSSAKAERLEGPASGACADLAPPRTAGSPGRRAAASGHLP